MPELFAALVLGMVQGVAELLPISSSGHQVIVEYLMGIEQDSLQLGVVLHVGTVAAILTYFRQELLATRLNTWTAVAVSALPAALLGLAFYDQVNQLFETVPVVAGALILTGVGNMLIHRLITARARTTVTAEADGGVSKLQAVGIGFAQALAMIPGLSRSGTTFLTSQALGVPPHSAFYFIFIMSVPVILGAAGYELLRSGVGLLNLASLAGFVSAFLTSLLTLTLFRRLLSHPKFFWVLGWYCCLLGTGMVGVLLLNS